MSVSFQSTTFAGVNCDPNGIIHRLGSVSGGVPNGPSLALGIWVKRQGTAFEGFGGQQRICQWAPNGAANNVEVYVSASTHNFVIEDTTNGATDTGVNCTDNTWFHVGFSAAASGGNTDFTLTVNGTQIAAQTGSFAWSSMFEFSIGSHDDGFSPNKWGGEMSDAIVYTRSLTSSE